MIAFVLLSAALIYNYVKKTNTPVAMAAGGSSGSSGGQGDSHNAETTKKKVVNGLTIASLSVLLVSLLSSIWQYAIVSKAADTCI